MESIDQLRTGLRDRARFSAENEPSDGSPYPVEISLLYSATDTPAIVAIVQDLTQRRQLEALRDRMSTFAIERQPAFRGVDLTAIVAEITEMAVTTLDVERASVWRIEGEHLECVDAYEQSADRHTVLPRMPLAGCPTYLKTLETQRSIAATDAVTDPRTREFATSYFTPLGIVSTLDASIRLGSVVIGALSLDHAGQRRVWLAEEQIIAATIADSVALAFEAAERRRAEDALRRSEERYRTAFENATVGVAEVSVDGHFMSVNREMCRILGYEPKEFTALGWRDISHSDGRLADTEGFRGMLSGESSVYRREKRYVRKDGVVVWGLMSAGPVRNHDGSVDRLVVVVQDVSEEHDLQAQLAHAQKMDSVGRLAGGIAHDFNNLLTAIIGYVELCRAAASLSPELLEDLGEIEHAAHRAADLTGHLLTFARQKRVDPQIIDINQLTRRTEKLLHRLIGASIELESDLDPDLVPVRMDPGQFEQVLVNLAVNARDAMPEGGRLSIITRNAKQGDDGILPGAVLEVRDTGAGMSADVQPRIFEPFFTTKGPSGGTGLGLSICWGIIEQAGGRITVVSEPGSGTTIRVWLPPSIDLAPGQGDARPLAMRLGEGESVLVVEDEAQVRRLVERTLRRHGYNVVAVPGGVEAIELLDAARQRIDVVLTDLVMPGMDGRELAERIGASHPELPILFMSGYTDRARLPTAILEGRSFLVSKPFSPAELVRRISDALDARPETHGRVPLVDPDTAQKQPLA